MQDSKVLRVKPAIDKFEHCCPGCGQRHLIPHDLGFNGDMVHPTFATAIRHRWTTESPYDVDVPDSPVVKTNHVCCYSIVDGSIVFHEESTHKKAGRTVSLPEYPSDE